MVTVVSSVNRIIKRTTETCAKLFISSSVGSFEWLQTSLEEKNTKPFYRYIKAQKNDNFRVSSLKFNGLMYSDSLSKSEILNKQFHSVFTKKAPQLLLD